MSAPTPPPKDATTHAEQLFDAADSALGNVHTWCAGNRSPEDHAAALERLRGYLDTIDDASQRLRAMLPPPASPESL